MLHTPQSSSNYMLLPFCKSSQCRHGCFNEGCNERSGCLASLCDVAWSFMASHYNVQFASANYNAPYHYAAPRPDHKLDLQLQASIWERGWKWFQPPRSRQRGDRLPELTGSFPQHFPDWCHFLHWESLPGLCRELHIGSETQPPPAPPWFGWLAVSRLSFTASAGLVYCVCAQTQLHNLSVSLIPPLSLARPRLDDTLEGA